MSSMSDLIEFYGEPIHTYTRAQALADGVLVDAGELAKEAGYNLPVALTSAAWADLVAWSDAIDRRKPEFTGQDETGRLWDVLNTARYPARQALHDASQAGTGRRGSHVYRVPPTGRGVRPKATPYVVVVDGDGMTIMLPSES